MWLLPPNIPGAHLPDGVHLLPGHYTREERDLLLALLRRVLPGDTRTFVLDPRMADEALARGARFQEALVLVYGEAPGSRLRERVTALGALGAHYLLVQPTEGDEGTAWLEGALKVPLAEWVRHELRRPDYPLASFGVTHLRVREAAAATADPLTFLRMIERAIEHRLRFAPVGTEPSDWARSLRVVAPDRLKRKAASPAIDEAMPHRRLLHIARELALLAADSTWSCGWEVEDVSSAEYAPFGEDVALTRGVLEATRIRGAGYDDQHALRRGAAAILARLRLDMRRAERDPAERASFAVEALGFITAPVPEMLARWEEAVDWIAVWSSRNLRVWQRHCLGNVALALAHALLRGRRTAGDVRVARHLLDAVDALSATGRSNATDALRTCASFCAEGEAPGANVGYLVRALFAIERAETDGAHPAVLPGRALTELYGGWEQLTRSGRPSHYPFGYVGPEAAAVEFVNVRKCVAHVARGEIDEAIERANSIVAHAALTVERTFAREVVATAQALRGSTDVALEAFLAARETYAALEDPLRLGNVDAQIAALRANG